MKNNMQRQTQTICFFHHISMKHIPLLWRRPRKGIWIFGGKRGQDIWNPDKASVRDSLAKSDTFMVFQLSYKAPNDLNVWIRKKNCAEGQSFKSITK